MVTTQRTLVVGLTLLLGGGAAGVIASAPPPVVQDAAARAAVEASTILLAALATCLLFGRARGGGGGRDLVIAWSVASFAIVEATASLRAVIAAQDPSGADATAWLLVAGTMAVAAVAPGDLVGRAGRRTSYALAAGLVALALVLLTNLSGPLAGSGWAPYLVAAVAAAAAAVGFAGRAVRDGDELQAWIAAAALLLAGAQLSAAAHAIPAPDWITVGDLLRGAAALVLLAGSLRQIGTYPSPATRRALAQERRRIARDLHDGLAQELAYVAAHAPRLAARSEDPLAARIAEAAQCALDESRLAMTSLSAEPAESLGRALTRAAERIAWRAGGVVRADLQEGVEVEPAVRSDLVRIVREATTNAVRHGGACEVSLSLTAGDALVLQIADDGVGFRPDGVAAASSSGFGLSSMRERAERAGGCLRVDSDPERGTVVEVRIA